MKGPDTLLPPTDEAPSQSPRAPAWGPLALAVAAWLWASWTLLAWHQSPMDEANQLAQAWRVAQGGRLYQEVWEFAGPLPIWGMAWVYGLTGPSLTAARCVAAALLGLSMALAALLARNMGARPWGAAWAASLLALGAMPHLRACYHHWWAWAWALGAWAWWSWAQGTEGRSRGGGALASVGAGLLAGGAAWCNLAVGASAGLALAGAALAWPWRRRWALWGGLVLGFGLATGAITLAFAWEGGGMALWQQVLVWPMGHYRQAGGINDVAPFSDWPTLLKRGGQSLWVWPWDLAVKLGVQALHLLGPLVALVGAIAWWGGRPEGGWAEAWRAQVQNTRLLLALGATLAWAMAWQGRADSTHLAVASLPSLPLLAALWPRRAWLAGLVLLALVAGQELRQLRAFLQEGRVAWNLDASIRQSEGVAWVLAHLTPQARVQSFPCEGLLMMFTPLRLATPYALVHPVSTRYWDAEMHEGFRERLRAAPPELLVVSGPWITEGDLQHLVGPKLWASYRLVGSSQGWVAARFYTRKPLQAPTPSPAGP